MRKHLALNWRRRPSLDSLESRYLLSGGIEVIEVHPAPALIIGIDFRQTTYPADGFWKPGNLVVFKWSWGLADARAPSRFLSLGRMGHACPRIPYLFRSPGGFTMDTTHFGIGKCCRIDTEL